MGATTWSEFGFGLGTLGAGNVINAGASALNTWLNYRFNEKAANNADQRQRAMYNDLYSPAAKLQQYRDAGISPSLAFSQGGAGAGGVSAPQGAGAAGPSFAGGKLDATQLATIKNIEADTNLKNAENKLLGEQTIKQQIENFISSSLKDTTIEKACAELELIYANINKTKEETRGQAFTNELNEEQREKLVQEIKYKVDNLILDLYVKASQGDYNYKRMKQIDDEIQLWHAQTMRWIRQSEIEQENVNITEEWYTQQAEILYEKLGIDKWLAEIKSEELGLKAEANQIEKRNAVLRLIGDGLKAIGSVAGGMIIKGGK